ncbi:MAG: PAS domain S-box protein [Thermoplasmata archaeon]|nr:PAS domain S-box protein [Thermoplasmata archaeon]
MKKIVEDRNKKLKELYEYIINHIYNTILVIQNRKIKFVNSSATVSGYEPEELTGKKVDSLVIEEDREKILKKMEEKLKGKGEGKPTHYRIKRKDGKIMKIEAISRKIEWEGKPALLTCISMIDNK